LVATATQDRCCSSVADKRSHVVERLCSHGASREYSHEVTAWQDHRNKHHAKADWQFTTANARVKLKRLYPQFE
jgi:hypothetical protein